MDVSNPKKDRARRIISMLYTPPGVIDADDLLLSPELLDEVNRMISQAHELYFDMVTGKALLRWKPEYETGNERMLDRTTQTDRMVLFIIYLTYRHPYISEEIRTGKPTEQRDVSRDTVLRIAEKAGMNIRAVDRALSVLTRLGYLEGNEWPRKTGLRLRALPNELFSGIEESAFRWHILVSAGLEAEPTGTTIPEEDSDPKELLDE
jgi:hypothetical protein